MKIFPLLLALFAIASTAQQNHAKKTGINVLRKARPSTTWHTDTAIVADVTCDGEPDTIVIGSEAEEVWVGVVQGSKNNKKQQPILFNFRLGAAHEDRFCARPVRIETAPIDCNDDAGPIRGCKIAKGCRQFAVIDDECDSFHFYWNDSRKTLEW